MKRIIFLLVAIVIAGVSSIGFYLGSINVFKDNKRHYEYFKEEKLVGVDGEINLSGIVAEKDELYVELTNLFQGDNLDYDSYLNLIEDKKSSNATIQKEIDDLAIKVSDLEEKKNSLNSEYNVLVKKYERAKKNSVSTVVVSNNNSYNFPLINQYPRYQTGCESVALTMLLQYYGVSVTPDMVIDKLKKGSLPYFENGNIYGGNPEVEFVGNPYSNGGYGVYEKPIAEVASMFKSGIQVRSNFSFSEVINLVQKGTPVMVWTSMGLSLPYISSSWIYKPTMEIVNWKANEHAVVMVGASGDTVVIADPIGGKLKTYSRAVFENRYNYYGKKALYYL